MGISSALPRAASLSSGCRVGAAEGCGGGRRSCGRARQPVRCLPAKSRVLSRRASVGQSVPARAAHPNRQATAAQQKAAGPGGGAAGPRCTAHQQLESLSHSKEARVAQAVLLAPGQSIVGGVWRAFGHHRAPRCPIPMGAGEEREQRDHRQRMSRTHGGGGHLDEHGGGELCQPSPRRLCAAQAQREADKPARAARGAPGGPLGRFKALFLPPPARLRNHCLVCKDLRTPIAALAVPHLRGSEHSRVHTRALVLAHVCVYVQLCRAR